MRVLFVTYDNPFTGRSGVSMYCRDLIPALAERGVNVGVVYVAHRDWRLRPYIRASTAKNVTRFALVNSPLNPEDSLHRPGQDSRQPAIEALVRRCLGQYSPDILHVQTLQGYPGSILTIGREQRIATVVMLHDFWAICPRLGLMRPHGEVCEGPNGGLNCLQFCVRPRPWRRRLYQFGTRLPPGRLRAAFLSARALYLRSGRGPASLWTPAPEIPASPDKRLLSQHAARSNFFLRALSEADQLLAVSDFVQSVFVRHGIPAGRIRTLSPALALTGIAWKSRCARDSQIRFGFLGRMVPMKGAHVFAAAIRDIPKDRARFLMFGGASPETQRYLQELSGDGRLEFRGPYPRDELPKVLDEVDVVVVPSVVQETVGLVTLEAHAAGVPVLGSRIGAIPEYVQDGENGLLFAPGDPQDLRDKILRIIENPSLVAAMSARTRPPMTLGAHVDALLDVYATATGKGRSGIWTRSSV